MSLPFHLDPRFIFPALVFLAVFSMAQSLMGLGGEVTARRAVNRRLRMAEKIVPVGDRIIELRKGRGLTATGERVLAWTWFADLVLKSGVTFEPRRWAMFAVGVGTGVGLAIFVLTKHPLIGLAVGAVVIPLAPVIYLKFMAGRREKKLGQQLPGALDVVVRSLEAGHPVATAVNLVGQEMPDPIGSEFGMTGDEIAFGSGLSQAVGRMAERCRHQDIDLFAATVRLQEKAGGNLVGLLKMNSHTIRERQKMRLKIKAATSEGRASAMILTAAPFAVVTLLQVMSPHFYGDVINEKPVQIGLAILGGWMLIGNFVMRRMIAMKI
jgi:tight adherence protein B